MRTVISSEFCSDRNRSATNSTPPTIQRSNAIRRSLQRTAWRSTRRPDESVRKARCDRASALLEVDAFSQFLAGLEMRDVLFRHLDPLAGLGVASGAGRPVVEAEAAEAADLDSLPLGQAFGHGVEDHLHRDFGVFGYQLRELRRQAADQLRFGHHGLTYPCLSS